MQREDLDDDHVWTRIADPAWADPLDASYSSKLLGGRWTAPAGPDTLYLNEDDETARANIRRFFAGSPVMPEDLDDENGFVLVDVVVPAGQVVVDAHTDVGLKALGLPPTYPLDGDGNEVGHDVCQAIGRRVFDADLDGIHCRSAAGGPESDRRELAWFPRGRRATRRRTRRFVEWYLGVRDQPG
jgi:hypothetical protein